MLFAMLYDTKNDAPSLCDIIASCSEAVVAADNETPSGGVTLTHDDPCQGLVLTIPSHIINTHDNPTIIPTDIMCMGPVTNNFRTIATIMSICQM